MVRIVPNESNFKFHQETPEDRIFEKIKSCLTSTPTSSRSMLEVSLIGGRPAVLEGADAKRTAVTNRRSLKSAGTRKQRQPLVVRKDPSAPL